MQSEALKTTWATYQAAWEDVGPEERQQLLNTSVTDDCVYSDPNVECSGRVALVEYIEAFRQSLPGGTFKNHTFLDHHAQSIAEWSLNDASGAELQPGKSYARYDEDHRITVVTGFFQTPPSE